MSSVSHADNQQDTETNNRSTLREANFIRQLEWDADGQITLAYRGNELAGEVGEACNVIKKLERERMGIRGSRDTLAHLAEELADVIICVDLIATSVGIDLDKAVRDKFNATSEKNGLKTRLVTEQVCVACGEPWHDDMSCGQKNNEHPFPVCVPTWR